MGVKKAPNTSQGAAAATTSADCFNFSPSSFETQKSNPTGC